MMPDISHQRRDSACRATIVQPDVVIHTDQLGRIVEWDDAMAEIYEFDSDDVVGKLISVLFVELDATRTQNRIRAALSFGMSRQIHRHRRKDGSTFWAELRLLYDSGTPVPTHADSDITLFWQVTDLTGIVDDIVEPPATCRSARDQLVSTGIIHEIRQPLSVLTLSIDLAFRRFRPTIEEADNPLGKILIRMNDQVDRIQRITDSMVRLADNTANVVKSVDVNAMVRRVAARMHRSLVQHQTRLLLKLCVTDPPAQGDELHLEEILINLINNAVAAMQRHTRDHGRWITITTRHGGNAVQITVADTGSGLPEHTEIFDPYQSAHTGKHNLGIGLTLIKMMLAKCGGSISAANIETGGAAFTVTLVLASEETDRAYTTQ